ncbi:DUF1853 family protein [uncultured Winogradskyella sp.]|uniref:DUF1853 family protein n=1 Tax=uncultured Winogradskyella sp. TaxID=395353 RepID=UPI0030EE77FD|tara:strand:- start:669 stop:1478 length:810 start_codon:yes stop_codon:yes gene_type:complete
MENSTILRYNGYLNTPSLFKTDDLLKFDILQLKRNSKGLADTDEFKNQRLGKLVEEFVFHQLKQESHIKFITENLQIQNGKLTIGEIDALYYNNEQPIHLEIVYKFYLYDSIKTYNNPLSYWIGPNRNDALDYKLEKLKTKQFPLLYRDQTKLQLEMLDINTENVKQQLCFKAQLFLPYNNQKNDVHLLNEDCVSGFYSSFNAINDFEQYSFYIPVKLDWLIKPHYNVEWLTFETAKFKIEKFIIQKKSPLVWLKNEKQEFIKCFITWW